MKGSKIVLSLLAVLTLVSMTALAGDVSGSWKSTMQGPNGAIERTFVLKQDGAKLTGKVVTPRGEVEIKDGKVDGDNIEFVTEQPGRGGGEVRKTQYKGKVSGDEIKGTQGAGDRSAEWVATKQK